MSTNDTTQPAAPAAEPKVTPEEAIANDAVMRSWNHMILIASPEGGLDLTFATSDEDALTKLRKRAEGNLWHEEHPDYQQGGDKDGKDFDYANATAAQLDELYCAGGDSETTYARIVPFTFLNRAESGLAGAEL